MPPARQTSPAASPATVLPPRALIGVLLMVGAMASLPFMDVLAKFLGEEGLPVLQIVWARVAFGALLTLPLAWRHGGLAVLWPQRAVYHAFRAGFLIAATCFFFLALTYLPMADALAIFFVQPLVLTVLSAVVLREVVGPKRWAAVAVGFIGTLIIIRPGVVEVNPGSLMALAAGACLAVYLMMTRKISGQAPAMLTTFQTNLIGALMIGGALPFLWQTPTPMQWAMMAGLGAIATYGHYLIVRAYDFAEASLLAPLAYTEIIMATVLGWVFFDDLPDGYTILGVCVLIACALYISFSQRNVGVPPVVDTP